MNNVENILALLKQPGSLFVNVGGNSGVAAILKSLCEEIIKLRKELEKKNGV